MVLSSPDSAVSLVTFPKFHLGTLPLFFISPHLLLIMWFSSHSVCGCHVELLPTLWAKPSTMTSCRHTGARVGTRLTTVMARADRHPVFCHIGTVTTWNVILFQLSTSLFPLIIYVSKKLLMAFSQTAKVHGSFLSAQENPKNRSN